jgi:glycopeptide antibiotics resistance protein
MPPRAPHPVATVLAVVGAGVVAFLTLGPRFVIAPLRGAFLSRVDAALAPFSVALPYGQAEQILNAVMFVPLGAGVAALVARRWWVAGVIAGFAVSTTVEVLQGAVPGRVPDPADVVWNTLGATVGAVAALLVRAIAAGVRRATRARSRPLAR